MWVCCVIGGIALQKLGAIYPPFFAFIWRFIPLKAYLSAFIHKKPFLGVLGASAGGSYDAGIANLCL